MKQHQTPCRECPFNREVKPGALGGSGPDVYIGQVFGGFSINCHMCIDYTDPHWKDNLFDAPQCAGTAIFRANCDVEVDPRLKRYLLALPVNTEKVFADPVEFLMHHSGIPRAMAEIMLDMMSPTKLAMLQIQRTTTKVHVVLDGENADSVEE